MLPKEAELGDHLMWKLRVAVYGLSDASRSWYLTARRILEETGLFESKIESSLFYSVDDQGHLNGILAMHVDDLLYGGTEQFLLKMEVFKSKVVVGNIQSQSVTFCGLIISARTYGLEVCTKEDDNIVPFEKGNRYERKLTQREETKVRGIIGSLQWAASSNRPDLSFPLAMALSELNKSKSVRSIKTANQLIDKYYGRSDVNLKIRPLTGHLDFEVYGDSALKYSQQQGVVAVLRNPNTDMVNVLSWRSRKAERRIWSTLAAETFVLQKAIDKAVYLKGLMKEMGAPISKVTAITDNLSLRRVVYSGRPTQEKRMKKKIAVVRDAMVTEQVEV